MKKIYQTKDSNGQEKTWINIKPEFNNGVYYDFKYNNEIALLKSITLTLFVF